MSKKPVLWILASLLPLCGTLAARAEKPKEPLVDQVRKAIKNGVQFLRDQEKGNGNWEAIDKLSVGMKGGWTALAMLALLNCDVKPDDPIIERGLKYLREIDPHDTYVVALQTMVFADTGRNEDRERIQRNVNWLVEAAIKEGTQWRGWTYGLRRGHIPDNSNTQYALLGLHAGHLAGAKIDPKVWKAIQDFYAHSQLPDHSWVYNQTMTNKHTMTSAGVCGLIISGMELNPGREKEAGDGTWTKCGEYDENKALNDGLDWIGNNFRPYRERGQWKDLPRYNYYHLYGIERVGRLSGQRFLGSHDWYRTGCEYLVSRQKEDGSWHETGLSDSWPVISTSFALLFLSKGRTPILVSKMVHGPGEDWNNDRNDIRNLVNYATKEVFHKLPLGWQVFDTRQKTVANEDELLELVRDLLQSPIAYFNGHEAPRFTGVEEKILKQFIEQGGFLFAEACCGRKEFDQGFRKLMAELFPENPLKRLPPEHPIWRAHADIPPDAFDLWGIEYGCKTVVIYSPQDLSCRWEANQYQNGNGRLAFRLGGNIIAYATGMEPPKPRLTEAEVVREDPDGKHIRRGYLRAAQLRHEGDWQPAPNAMRNLLSHLRGKAQLDVTLQTQAIYPQDPNLIDFRFLYMHGRASFSFSSPKAIDNLRTDLETGGLLLADACCGKQAFDISFRELIARLFPDKKLEPIPLNDDLYSKELNRTAITTVRCRTELAGNGGQTGEYHEVAPALEGIRIGNRWAVVYSKYDIGCALEKHQSTDCLGHDHDSALKLGSAVVLYALKR